MALMAQATQLSSTSDGTNFGSTTVYNPGVPFIQKNVGAVQAGKLFYISGIPSQNPTRMTINLESGQDKLFHFDVRFSYNRDHFVIVRNTFRNNGWGKEERALGGAFPFTSDTFFDILILIDSSAFKVAVNNQPLLDYRHRMPFQRIDTLRIRGDVRLCQTQLSSTSDGANFGSTTVYNPGVPFIQKNVGTVHAGKLFYISGITSQNPTSMTINLESRQDKLFHFDVRFNYLGERNVIVRNTFRNNGWGQGERKLDGAFPFTSDTFFDMLILIDSSAFKVAVNNQPLLNYRHRMPFQLIDTLRIRGDVRLCQTQRSSTSDGANFGSTTVYNPGVPFVQKNVGTVQAGKLFYISGIPSQNPKRMTISLGRGQDKLFHVGVRFNYLGDRHVIVRNTFRNNGWGQAERTLGGAFPFTADTFFDMLILIDSSAFKVAVNNQPLLEYRHRMPFQRINTLRIRGDVRLCQVRF